MNVREEVAGAVERRQLGEHDGRSGGLLERVMLADGTWLVVKRTSPRVDFAMAATGDRDGREAVLWEAGVLDRLPHGVGHAILDAWREDGEVVVVMRELRSVVGWTRRLTRDECRQILSAAARTHDGFSGSPVAGLCPLAARVGLLTPRTLTAIRVGENPLPALVARGWERFGELVRDERADAVLALVEDPSPLVAALQRHEPTLLHGDLWLVNLALEPREVVLLDWGIATWGPPAVEFACFLSGNASQVDASREQILDDVRAVSGERHDEDALRLALVFGLVELGWNKALDAVEHEDPAKREQEWDDLSWWLAAAEPGLELLGSAQVADRGHASTTTRTRPRFNDRAKGVFGFPSRCEATRSAGK